MNIRWVTGALLGVAFGAGVAAGPAIYDMLERRAPPAVVEPPAEEQMLASAARRLHEQCDALIGAADRRAADSLSAQPEPDIELYRSSSQKAELFMDDSGRASIVGTLTVTHQQPERWRADVRYVLSSSGRMYADYDRGLNAQIQDEWVHAVRGYEICVRYTSPSPTD